MCLCMLWIEGESGCHGGERWKWNPLFDLYDRHPPDSEADQSKILVANRLNSIDLLLFSCDSSKQHVVIAAVCSVNVIV